MVVRHFAVLLVALLIGGCHGRQVVTPEPGDLGSETPSAREPDPYAGYDFPAIADDWSPREYTEVADLLVAIDRAEPELLLTLAGPKGDLLARFASLDAIGPDVADAEDIDALLELTYAVAQSYKLYASRVIQKQAFGPEYLLLSAAMLRASAGQYARLTAVLDEATLRAEPVRREGLIKMRYGVVSIYLGALQSPLDHPAIVEPNAALTQLGAVTADVGPFLLPEERKSVDELLAELAIVGADAQASAAIRASLAESTMDPLIAAFASEVRAFSDTQRQLYADVAEQQRSAVELGPEDGGVRYAFPDAGFSAVFHQRPNAMLSTVTATDGVAVTTRMLGISDATGYSTMIVCMSRPTAFADGDERGFARQAIESAEATDVREVEIDGRRGFEGATSSSTSRAFMLSVAVGHGGCTIIAEYPPRLESSYGDQGRAFVRSVDLGDFEG